MTSLRDMGCILIMCIFGTAFAKDTDNNIQRKVDVLENKVAYITKKDSARQVVIEQLLAVVSLQGNKLEMLEKENKLLMEKIDELQKQRDNSVSNEEHRVRRQILNTSYEGPTAFMSSLGPQCESNLGVDQNIAFKSVLLNKGGAYNPLHGVFTAPRDGVYIFSAALLSDNKPSSAIVHATISVNGNKAAKILAISEPHQHRDQGSNTLIAELKRGDQVWVKNIDNNAVTICGINGYSTFSGYLLYPY